MDDVRTKRAHGHGHASTAIHPFLFFRTIFAANLFCRHLVLHRHRETERLFHFKQNGIWWTKLKRKKQREKGKRARESKKENENNKGSEIKRDESQNWKTNNYDDESVRMERTMHNGLLTQTHSIFTKQARTHTFALCTHNGLAFEWRSREPSFPHQIGIERKRIW